MRWRVLLGILLLFLSAGTADVTLFRSMAAVGFRFVELEEAARYEQRFEPVRRALDPHTVPGYVDDQPTAPGRYFLVQYVLAPVVIAPDANRELVISNFVTARGQPPALSSRRFQLREDFGNGIRLYRTEAN